MGTTPIYGLPYPDMTDSANVPADIKALAESFEQLAKDLAAAEVTSPITITATSEAAAQPIITLPAITLETAYPILLQFVCPYAVPPNTANAVLIFTLYEKETRLGRLAQIRSPGQPPGGSAIFGARRLEPGIGTFTYSVRGSISAGTSATATAGPGGAGNDVPLLARIRRV